MYALSVIVITGCAGSDGSLPTLRDPELRSAKTILSSARTRAALGPQVSAAEFQARNPMRKAGAAHSFALRAFLHEFVTTSRGKPCQSIGRALEKTYAKLGADIGGSASERRVAIDSIVQACKSRKPKQVRTASFVPAEPKPVFVAGALTGDVDSYLEAIEEAIETEGATPQLVTVINAIVDDAETVLVGDELGAVQLTSSIAIDSYDYWYTQGALMAGRDSVYQWYLADCEREDPEICTYETRGSGIQPNAIFRHASMPAGNWISCSQHYNWKDIIKDDFLGGAGGYLLERILRVAAIVEAGVVGSALQSMWQHSSFLGCLLT